MGEIITGVKKNIKKESKRIKLKEIYKTSRV